MKLKTDLFSITQPQRTPCEGDILVVEPFLNEVHFNRAVILIVDNLEQEGAVGVILNRSTRLQLSDVLHDAACRPNVPLYVGGPVEKGHLLYIHTLGDLIKDSISLGNGLYVGGDFNDVLLYLNGETYDPQCIKFFAGYCGWSVGQLEQEIAEKTWVVTELNDIKSAMLACDESYWNDIVESLGAPFRAWLNCPIKPHLN